MTKRQIAFGVICFLIGIMVSDISSSSSTLCERVCLQRTQKMIFQLHSTSGELFGWPFECNDRNFAGRLLLICAIGRKYFYCSLKRLFSLIAGENPGGGIKFLATNLNRNFRVSQQVEIPLRMFGIASFGRYCK